MITQELTTYIRGQIAGGKAKDAVTRSLLASGWSSKDIEDAYLSLLSNAPNIRSVNNEVSTPPARSSGAFALSFGLIVISTFYSFSEHIKAAQQSSMIADLGSTAPQQQAITTAVTAPASTPPPSTSEVKKTQTVMPTATPKKTPTKTTPKTLVVATSSPKAPTPTPTPVPVPTPTPVAPPKPKGQYVDGTYTGDSADAYYGLIQVQAVISGGTLVDVKFLSYPNDRRTSIEINGQALPYLRQEALSVQSANVDIVSGATDSSQAFQQSLGSALAKAKA